MKCWLKADERVIRASSLLHRIQIKCRTFLIPLRQSGCKFCDELKSGRNGVLISLCLHFHVQSLLSVVIVLCM